MLSGRGAVSTANVHHPAAIRNATNELRNVRQTPDEDELAFGARMNHAAYHFGNIHEDDEIITFFIDGLRAETTKLVTRFRENQYRKYLKFERIIQFAQDEGGYFRAMAPLLGTLNPSAVKPRPLFGILRIS